MPAFCLNPSTVSRWLGFLILLATISFASCDSPTDTDEGGGNSGTLVLSVPTTAVASEPFSATIEGTDDFDSATVTLSVSSGVVTPATATLNAGIAVLDLIVSDSSGEVIVSARSGAKEAQATILSLGSRTLPGDVGDVAAERTPDIRYLPEASDFDDQHPEVPGMRISSTILLVLPHADATVGQLNDLLATENGIVIGSSPGTNGVMGGLLAVRFPSVDHDSLADIMERLNAREEIEVAAPELELGLLIEPEFTTFPSGWKWALPPDGGNWGMELCRVPAMWNLNSALEKRGASVKTGIVDAGFAAKHPDLNLRRLHDAVDDHGTFVAGIIGATFGEKGIDGVNPFAEMCTSAVDFGVTNLLLGQLTWGSLFLDGIDELYRDTPNVRLINMSLGYNWGAKFKTNTNESSYAQAVANAHGCMFDFWLASKNALGSNILVVAASGNDSNSSEGFGLQDAKFASPMCNAALRLENPDILIVEAVKDEFGPTTDSSRALFSNVFGHISAPGEEITSAVAPSGYDTANGTSFSTPFVTGLIGYLLAIDPALSNAEIRKLLQDNAVDAAGGASPRVDAYATVMDIDELRGNTAVLEMMCDIDDGTIDGNTRLELFTGLELTSEDIDGDGGRGDGRVDMSDFRRWRDWYLQGKAFEGLALDGSPTNPKRDLDGNGLFGSTEKETEFARGDLNGSNEIDFGEDVLDLEFVPGAVNAEITDLQMLKMVFDDPYYVNIELDGLLMSGDIHVSAFKCLADPRVATARSRLEQAGSLLDEREHTTADGLQIYTVLVPTIGYSVTLDAFDSNGNLIGSVSENINPELGADVLWNPVCAPSPVVILTDLPPVIEERQGTPMRVRVGTISAEGDTLFDGGIQVDIVAQGGSVDPESGTTQFDGFFDTEVSVGDFSKFVDLFITATTPEGFENSIAVSASSPIPETVFSRQDFAHLALRAQGEEGGEGPDNFISTEEFGSVSKTLAHTMHRGTGSLRGETRIESDVVLSGRNIVSVRLVGSALVESNNPDGPGMRCRSKATDKMTIVIRRDVTFQASISTERNGPAGYTPFARASITGGGASIVDIRSEDGVTTGSPVSGVLPADSSYTFNVIADVGASSSSIPLAGDFEAGAEYRVVFSLSTLDGSPVMGVGEMGPAVEILRGE